MPQLHVQSSTEAILVAISVALLTALNTRSNAFDAHEIYQLLYAYRHVLSFFGTLHCMVVDGNAAVDMVTYYACRFQLHSTHQCIDSYHQSPSHAIAKAAACINDDVLDTVDDDNEFSDWDDDDGFESSTLSVDLKQALQQISVGSTTVGDYVSKIHSEINSIMSCIPSSHSP